MPAAFCQYSCSWIVGKKLALNNFCILPLPIEGFKREADVGAEAASGEGEGATKVIGGAAHLGGWERAADDVVLLLEPKQL